MKSLENHSNLSGTSNSNIFWVGGFILLALVSRFALPPIFGHPENFSPINATALFAGAYLGRKWMAFIIPILAVWISDLVLNYQYFHKIVLFYPGFYWQYGFYLLIVLFSSYFLSSKKGIRVPITAIIFAIAFFLVSNFGVWIGSIAYPQTFPGLMACYTAGLPFFRATLVSDLVYSSVLFFGFEWVRQNHFFTLNSAGI